MKKILNKRLKREEARVLVVDDDTLTRTLIAALVKQEAVAEVLTARNGSDALSKFPVFRPHIVFLDIDLGDPDGFETLRQINEFGITAQTVMVSATATPSRVQAARDAGAVGFLVKPVSAKRIGDSILECIKLSGKAEGGMELFMIT